MRAFLIGIFLLGLSAPTVLNAIDCSREGIDEAAKNNDTAHVRECNGGIQQIDSVGVSCANQYNSCLQNAGATAGALQDCLMQYSACDPKSQDMSNVY